MGAFRDSGLCLVLAASLLAAPAIAATAPAKQPVKAAAKPVTVAPPLNATDLINQARQAQTRGETELAVRLAQSAIVVDPRRPDTYVALGDIYTAQNEPDFARSYYNEALQVDFTDASALQALAALDRTAPDQRAANIQGSQTVTP